jgi:hypothetical protein
MHPLDDQHAVASNVGNEGAEPISDHVPGDGGNVDLGVASRMIDDDATDAPALAPAVPAGMARLPATAVSPASRAADARATRPNACP